MGQRAPCALGGNRVSGSRRCVVQCGGAWRLVTSLRLRLGTDTLKGAEVDFGSWFSPKAGSKQKQHWNGLEEEGRSGCGAQEAESGEGLGGRGTVQAVPQ